LFNLIIGFLNDVIIVGGTAITTSMLATKTVELPSASVWLVAIIMGLVQAARRLDSKMAPTPMKDTEPAVRTEADLMAQVKVRENAVTAAAEAIRRAVEKASAPEPTTTVTVTPKRVEVEQTPPPPEKPAVVPGSVL